METLTEYCEKLENNEKKQARNELFAKLITYLRRRR